jgi:2-keto-4-pentenoate hydratase
MMQEDIRHTNSTAARAARLLCQARSQHVCFDRFPTDLVPKDERDAYVVQDVLHTCLTEHGWGRVVGHKIGCTTPVMQAYLGIPNPCAGGVFESSVQHEYGRFARARFLRVGVECEIAVRLSADLPPEARPFDRERAASAIGACMAAIEIVEDRYVDYPSLDTPTLIADDFFGAGCVLGAPVEGFDPFHLPDVRARMSINGQEVGSGAGTDILGHPLDALVWLANTAAERGSGLRRGEFILLGSLVQTHWVEAGDTVAIVNEPLGIVHAQFA